jgi:3-oxoadipate CoA-transferase, alpha subunit
MAIDKRVASAAEAIGDVPDGATVFIPGFGGAGFPNTLVEALCALGPRDLTLVVNSATHRYSKTHLLIEAGLVRRVQCSAARGPGREPNSFERLLGEGRIELEVIPQGTFTERIRAGGAGIPAFYTPVGVGTDLAAGKEVRRFGDRDYLMETAITGQLALLRGDSADRYGNIAFRYAQANFGPVMATAAAVAVAEVRRFEDEPMPHGRVQLPGSYVDRVFATGE